MESVVIELETHAIMDLVILEGDVILVDIVPLLDPNLLGPGSGLSGNELLQVADRVVLVALHPYLLPETIVENHLNHLRNPKELRENFVDMKKFGEINAVYIAKE